jgi:hypothetical protein
MLSADLEEDPSDFLTNIDPNKVCATILLHALLMLMLVAGHEEDEGQLNQDDLAALPQSATAKSVSPGPFGIATSRRGQSSRGVSPTPTEPQASKPDASLTKAATTPPPPARAPSSASSPARIHITQERAKVDHSEAEMPEYTASQPGLKRPFTSDDAVHVRTRTNQEPERKRPRGATFM